LGSVSLGVDSMVSAVVSDMVFPFEGSREPGAGSG
jgi:hypothetical protein